MSDRILYNCRRCGRKFLFRNVHEKAQHIRSHIKKKKPHKEIKRF